MGTGVHRNNFDALRLGAALAVLVSHMYLFTDRPQPEVDPGVTLGILAVMVFFSISGYLVSASWRHDPSLGRFLIRRGLRIIPGLFVVWCVMAAVRVALPDGFTMNPVAEVNGSLWTIPFEVQCYLLFAAGAVLIRSPALMLVLILLVAFRVQYSWLVLFGAFFAAGAFLDQYPALRSRLALPAWLAVGAALLYVLPAPYVGLAFIVAPLSIWVGTSCWPVLRSVGRYGDFSYGTYLYACIVQQTLVAFVGGPFWLLLGLSTVLTLGLAWASWRFVEAPALALKDCLTSRSPTASRSRRPSVPDQIPTRCLSSG